MTDGAARLVSHKAEQARLAQLQSELAAQRREEIGQLAGRLGVLETEDCMLAGQWRGETRPSDESVQL